MMNDTMRTVRKEALSVMEQGYRNRRSSAEARDTWLALLLLLGNFSSSQCFLENRHQVRSQKKADQI